MRILVLAHGHPDLSAGGGERAAYALFRRLKHSPHITQAAFAAYASPEAKRQDTAQAILERPDEFLVTPPPIDGFTFQTFGYDELQWLVGDLIAATRPNVVHIHHFLFWGLEIVELFRKAGVRVVLTLHEYAAICAHYGQMIRADGRLCHGASPAECAGCFPSLSSGRFFVRATIVRSLLDAVDHFIAPSTFLKSRYVAWGLQADRITVIENLLDASVVRQAQAHLSAAPPAVEAIERPVVFGYFAQINPFKGFDVLLEAASLLPEDVRRRVVIRIHGENRHYRGTEFHTRTETLLAQVRDVVAVMGSYRGDNVISLMAACDWIIVPSIWWENSPVVMQEARLAARPLIVSDIGGMAEKSDPAVDYRFPARSAGALATLITDCVTRRTAPNEEHLRRLADDRIQDDEGNFARHWAIYDRLLTSPRHRSSEGR
jgi:glycosyltransferase involved in cell wall biosynthesis